MFCFVKKTLFRDLFLFAKSVIWCYDLRATVTGGPGRMALEDVEWQERYGDQSYKSGSLLAIRVALLALFFAQVVVLPSMAVYLSTLHASTSMLGYCLAATCIGEMCAQNLFSMWYDRRPAREVVVGSLVLNAFASFLYAVAPHRIVILFSRFLVGFAGGVQAPLMTMIGAFTNRYNRSEVLAAVRATYLLAFILGAGLSTSVTFVHMHNPGLPLDEMKHTVPSYVSAGQAAARGEINSAASATQAVIQEAEAAVDKAMANGEVLSDNSRNSTDRAAWSMSNVLRLWAPGPADGAVASREGRWAAPNKTVVDAAVVPASLAAEALSLIQSVQTAFSAWDSARNGTGVDAAGANEAKSSAAKALVQMQV
jgi:hypothetical protein